MITLPVSKEEYDEISTGARIAEGEFLCEVNGLPYEDVVGQDNNDVIKFPISVVEGQYQGFETDYTIFLCGQYDEDGSKGRRKLKGFLTALGIEMGSDGNNAGFEESECIGKQFIGVFKKDKNGYSKLMFGKPVSEGTKVLEELPS